MTENQKEQIASMRLSRDSYTTIAATLGLSRNTVKSYCQRNVSVENESAVIHGQCEMCAKTIVEIPGRRKRRFCSDACRMAWWNIHRNRIGNQTKVTYTCAACGKHFTDYPNHTRKYCSHTCYIAHRYGA